MLEDKGVATTKNLTREQFEDVGWQVARQRYLSTEAREDFAAGWLVFGLPTIAVMRSKSLSVKESHCEAAQTLPSNVLLFRKRKEGQNVR